MEMTADGWTKVVVENVPLSHMRYAGLVKAILSSAGYAHCRVAGEFSGTSDMVGSLEFVSRNTVVAFVYVDADDRGLRNMPRMFQHGDGQQLDIRVSYDPMAPTRPRPPRSRVACCT